MGARPLLSLVLVLFVHLLPALFAGLLVYELVHLAAPYLSARLSDHRAKIVVVALLAAAVVGIVTAASFAIVVFIQSDPDRPAALLAQFADMVLRAKETLPAWIADLLPADHDEVNSTLVGWMRAHAADLELAGRDAGRALIYAILGMIVGAMIALQGELERRPSGPLGRALAARAANLSSAFRRVVFAQVRISLINTVFTAHLSRRAAARVRRRPSLAQDAHRHHVRRGAAARRGQPHLQHLHRHREPDVSPAKWRCSRSRISS